MLLRRTSITPVVLALALLGVALPAASAEALSLKSQTSLMSGADAKERLTVRCQGKKSLPYGGGMLTDPLGPDGEGVYPHSFERLGVQRGFHVTPVLYAPAITQSSRAVTLQVVCGPRLGPVSSPHSTTFVRTGETGTAIATCPRGNRLLAGGFQRTNFVTRGGNYVTESRAVSDRAWQVSGGAFGSFGGELTAIAYCLRSRVPLLSEVSAQSALPVDESATATTPACPPGSSIVAGGFATSPTGPALVSSAYFNPGQSWSATAFNRAGPAATVSAHGYCMTSATIKRRQQMRHGIRESHEKSVVAPAVLDQALKVAISERVTNNGCYPSPADMVSKLRASNIQATVAGGPRAVRSGAVHVLTDQSSCESVRLAVRRGSDVIVLNSATGQVTKRRR